MSWTNRSTKSAVTSRGDPDGDADLDLDPTWDSKPSKIKVWSRVRELLTGNLNCFSRFEVRPLCHKRGFSHYRVNIYMKDLSNSYMVTSEKMWRTYYVITEGLDYKITLINPEIFKAG